MAPNGTNRGKGKEKTPNRNFERNKISSISLFLNDSSSGENYMSQLNQVVGKSKKKEFTCGYCKRKFSSSEALGGHQNAHKKERALDKGGQNMNVNISRFPPNTYHHYSDMNFSNSETYNKSPMIQSQNYSSFMFHDFLGSDEQKIDIPALDLVAQRAQSPTLNLILQLDCKVGIESSNGVDMIEYVEDPNGVNNNEGDSNDDEVESLDLTLKL